MVSALDAVLAAIARAVLGDERDDAVTLGSVTLRPHQREALRRVRASVANNGGALLADEPGLGKTFVALGLAREYRHAIIVAPAALRSMWRSAAAAAAIDAGFVSLETLSRRDAPLEARDGLVIVDEAHHVCNPATARYRRLARLVSYRSVLLLSATPVRNRRSEVAALLALFMGPRAQTLDDAALASCIVRRAGDPSLLPAIDGPNWHHVRQLRGVTGMLANIPPALPALDGREATALVSMTLARCWASSLAALDRALTRRLLRGAALGALLDAGRVPTRRELRAWVVGDDAVQLAFPMLAAHAVADAQLLKEVLALHLDAVRALRVHIAPYVLRDADARSRLLLTLRRAHRRSCIVAFTAHASTAEAVYRALAKENGVALLTAHGARSAGGARPRADIIGALAGTPAREPHARGAVRDSISLVVTTDLLSEGVNLQGASVIVHLDQPWTPGGLDQRVGRAARMGSPHAVVHVHAIAPAAAAERLLDLDRRHMEKHAERVESARAPRDLERLRGVVGRWNHGASMDSREPLVAFTCAERAGFIAVVAYANERILLSGAFGARGRWKISTKPGDVCAVASTVRRGPARHDAGIESRARAAVAYWLAARRARESSGASGPASRARRALLDRIDATLSAAGAHARPALSARAARVRARIDRAVGAGAEETLLELARLPASDVTSWLAACESSLARAPERAGAHRGDAPALRALLLLVATPNCSNAPTAVLP